MAERLTLIEEKADTMELAIADSNKYVKGMDKALGNAEHRIDFNNKLLGVIGDQLQHLQNDVTSLKRDTTVTHKEQIILDKRVTKLEAVT